MFNDKIYCSNYVHKKKIMSQIIANRALTANNLVPSNQTPSGFRILACSTHLPGGTITLHSIRATV